MNDDDARFSLKMAVIPLAAFLVTVALLAVVRWIA
jgi:hypothetical protein